MVTHAPVNNKRHFQEKTQKISYLAKLKLKYVKNLKAETRVSLYEYLPYRWIVNKLRIKETNFTILQAATSRYKSDVQLYFHKFHQNRARFVVRSSRKNKKTSLTVPQQQRN